MNESMNNKPSDENRNQSADMEFPLAEYPEDRVIAAFTDEKDSENDVECEAVSNGLTAEAVLPEKVEVVGIRFRTSGKVYFFDPNGISLTEGMHAVVETARGTEYGEVSFSNRQISAKDIVPPLRRVLRIANESDDAHYAENRQREQEAFTLCVSRINAYGLEMKLIDAEYTFDNSKLLFYFTADGRVDFRELVKNLAGLFRCRIELRQLGIRDEAKLLGGLGICGRPYCCHSFLPDFVQVSIKMAKEQGLSLNAAKISGACGRLMCCLRYENDVYVEEGKLTPKVGSIVHDKEGSYTVLEAKPLTGMLKVRPVNDPDGATQILSRDAVEPGMGEQASVSPKKPTVPEAPTVPLDSPAPAAPKNQPTGKGNRFRQGGKSNAVSSEKGKPEKAPQPEKTDKQPGWEIEKKALSNQNTNQSRSQAPKKLRNGNGNNGNNNKHGQGVTPTKAEENREPSKEAIPAENGGAAKRRPNNRGYRGNRRRNGNGNGDRKKQGGTGEQSGS